jgi:hypothetical protein
MAHTLLPAQKAFQIWSTWLLSSPVIMLIGCTAPTGYYQETRPAHTVDLTDCQCPVSVGTAARPRYSGLNTHGSEQVSKLVTERRHDQGDQDDQGFNHLKRTTAGFDRTHADVVFCDRSATPAKFAAKKGR